MRIIRRIIRCRRKMHCIWSIIRCLALCYKGDGLERIYWLSAIRHTAKLTRVYEVRSKKSLNTELGQAYILARHVTVTHLAAPSE